MNSKRPREDSLNKSDTSDNDQDHLLEPKRIKKM